MNIDSFKRRYKALKALLESETRIEDREIVQERINQLIRNFYFENACDHASILKRQGNK